MTTNEIASESPPAPPAPVYATELWDYLDTIEYMPSRQDREAVLAAAQRSGDDRRIQIWNYFFRIKPEDVGRPQQAAIASLKQTRKQVIAEHEAATRALSGRIEQLERGVSASEQFDAEQTTRQARKAELEQIIRDTGLRFRPHGLYVLGFGGIASLVLNLGVITSFLTSPFRDGPDMPFGTAFGTWLSGAIFWAFIGWLGYWYVNNQRVGKEQNELKRIQAQERDAERLRQNAINQHKLEIPKLKAELDARDVQLRPRVQEFSKQIDHLQAMIEALKAQLPTPPSDAQVMAWLKEDLERVQANATTEMNLDWMGEREGGEETEVSGRIKLVDPDPETGEEREIANPLVFIGPGELQDPERIPPPYRPITPQTIGRFSELTKSFSTDQLRDLVPLLRGLGQNGTNGRSQTIVQTDKAKHLLARRAASAENSYQIMHGVYYVQYLYIGHHTLTLHEFFYDFISDKVTSKRTTEQYYHDVVAIERAQEFRVIPLSYGDNTQSLEIEDAPTFTLILPSGDRRTVTFSNRDYLLGVMGTLPSSTGSEAQRLAFVKAEIDEAQHNAELAVSVIQHALRKHKLPPGNTQ
ncbi:MAG: hypothetical protein AB4911_10455 [Oscillochloridaceae bacterium umkhey_bin13]